MDGLYISFLFFIYILMEQETFWPYTYDDKVMDTEWWKFFINLYELLNTANLMNKSDTCVSILQSMADFLKECVDDWQDELVWECVNYLSDMPGEWINKLLLSLIYNKDE